MSELMDHAIIEMPFDMAMDSELSRRQFYFRAQTLLAERDALRAAAPPISGVVLPERQSTEDGDRAALGFNHALDVVTRLNAPKRTPLYTCLGKGGTYELLGACVGAGTNKGNETLIYRDINTGQLFSRLPGDFEARMYPLGAPK